MDKHEFQALIKKYLDGIISVKELKRLLNYYESFQKNNKWVEELGSEEVIKNKMLIAILESIETETKLEVIPFYRKSFFKYAVAASLVFFFGISFFFIREGVNSEKSVVNNSILIGTDKATLTLGDGSNVVLRKGGDFQSEVVKSSGKELIYNKSSTKEVPEVIYNYLTIPRGGQFNVTLSDGSRIWLNSDSQLKYPEQFEEGETRKVELIYGEAYFEISPSSDHNGAPFTVFSNKQEITVMGTQFNLKAYDDDDNIYTTLVEGKVKVQMGAQYVILSPKEQAIVHSDSTRIQVNDVDVYSVTAWKEGVFSFKNMPLEEIMKVLARWYDIEVIFEKPTLRKSSFDGVLRKNQHIEAILESIKTTNAINYEIEKNTVIFK